MMAKKQWDDGARPWGQPGNDCDCEAYLRYCNTDHPFCTYYGEIFEANDDYMEDDALDTERGKQVWNEYMREEGYKEYEDTERGEGRE